MTRDEAYQKATVAVADRHARLREARITPSAADLFVPNAQDWSQPSLHDVLAALEEIGVLRFDEPERAVPKDEDVMYVPEAGSLRQTSARISIGVVVAALRERGYVAFKPPADILAAPVLHHSTIVDRHRIKAITDDLPSYWLVGSSDKARERARAELYVRICKSLGV